MSVEKLKHAVPGWPNTLSWTSSFSGNDILVPDPEKAVVHEAVPRGDLIRLTVDEAGQSFSVALAFSQPDRHAILATLKRAQGLTLVEAGELDVEAET